MAIASTVLYCLSKETYGISQSDLAKAMGIRRGNVHCWVNELADPVSTAILEIRSALREINPEAAEEFMRLWLDESEDG
ncbi:MAG: XRE family transcriptional regulator [Leptolyngbyaceae cyanobacterium SM1_3_5]|nr:XRE family transcriptional regulator [Leptolyngbyaceae cyanobacterium SM1_3_5]